MNTKHSIANRIKLFSLPMTDDGMTFAWNISIDTFDGLDNNDLMHTVDERTVTSEMLDVLESELDRVNYAAMLHGCNELEPTEEDMHIIALMLAEVAYVPDDDDDAEFDDSYVDLNAEFEAYDDDLRTAALVEFLRRHSDRTVPPWPLP